MLSNVIHTIGTRGANAVLSVLIATLASRYLGAEVYGQVSLAMLCVSFFVLINSFVAGSPIVFFASKASIGQLALISLFWTLITLVLSFVVIVLVRNFFGSLYLLLPPKIWLLIPFVGLGSSIFGFFQNYFLGKKMFVWFNSMTVIQLLVHMMVLMGLVVFLRLTKVDAFLASFVISQFVIIAAATIKVAKMQNMDVPMKYPLLTKQVASYGGVCLSANLVQILNDRFSYLIISTSLSIAHLGVFSLATQIAEGMKLIARSISMVQYSQIINCDNKDENIRLTVSLLKLTFLFTLAVVIMVLIIPTTFYSFVFGKDFENLKMVILFLSLGIVAISVSLIFSHYFSGIGKPKYNLYASLMGFSMLLIVISPLIKLFGLYGAALSASFVYCTIVFAQAVMFFRHTRVGVFQIFPSKIDFISFYQYLKMKSGK